MAKVTSKLQVTIPKALAETVLVAPVVTCEAAAVGGTLHIVPRIASRPVLDREERLRLFRAATDRQNRRNTEWTGDIEPQDRGWTREDLYERGRPR